MRDKILIGALLLFVLASYASAEIIISQPRTVYNLGDTLDVSANIRAAGSMNDFVEMRLVCGNSSKVFYLSPVSLSAGQEEKVDRKLVLSDSFLEGMEDKCVISAVYDSEKYTSQIFKISRKIIVSIGTDRVSVNPNENVAIKGNAVKENSRGAEGFMEFAVEGAEIKMISPVVGGKINMNFSFPDDIRSGVYKVKARVYEKSGDAVTNEGEGEVVLGVKQEPRRMEIIPDKQSVIPGESLKFKTAVYDQAGDGIAGDVSLAVNDASGNLFLNKIAKSGEETEINFKEDSLFGSWTINSEGFGLAAEKNIVVEQLEKAKFEVLNNTLRITNVGNVPYKKAIQVEIGQEVKVIEMNLDLGGSKMLKLTGDGSYDISVSDGIDSAVFNGIGLTGGAIGVNEFRGGLSVLNKYPIVWLFLILVFGLFVFAMSQRVIKKKYYGYTPNEERGLPKIAEAIKNEGFVNISRKVHDAEPSLVVHGNKEDAGILVLKLKNYSELAKNKEALKNVEMTMENIFEHRGTVSRTNETFTGIFAPSVTKTFKNDLAAVQAASAIAVHLNEHNKKFSQKLAYGIGINSGEIATNIENGKLKFAALGNSINLARKIAEIAQNGVLISGNTNKKIMNEVKTLKQGEFYSISRIIEREQNKQFINKFVERNRF